MGLLFTVAGRSEGDVGAKAEDRLVLHLLDGIERIDDAAAGI